MAGASFPSSYISTQGSAVSRARPSFTIPISFSPQTLTEYVKFVERGGIVANQGRIALIGRDSSTAGNVNLGIDPNTNQKLRAFARDPNGFQGTADVLTNIEYGDVIEMAVTFDFSDGSIVARGAKNGGNVNTVDTGSGHFSAENTFGASEINMAVLTSGAISSLDMISGPIIAPGVRTMSEMRELAGT